MDELDDRVDAARRERDAAVRERDELEAEVARAREAAAALGKSARWPRIIMVAGAALWLGYQLGNQLGWPWGMLVGVAGCLVLALLAPRLELGGDRRDERRAMVLAEALRLHAQGARVRIERVRRGEPGRGAAPGEEVEVGVSRRRGRQKSAR